MRLIVTTRSRNPDWATRSEEADDPDLDSAAREFAEQFDASERLKRC